MGTAVVIVTYLVLDCPCKLVTFLDWDCLPDPTGIASVARGQSLWCVAVCQGGYEVVGGMHGMNATQRDLLQTLFVRRGRMTSWMSGPKWQWSVKH